MQVRTNVRKRRQGGGSKATRGDALRQELSVAAELATNPRTVAEVSESLGVPGRTVYRILGALQVAGWKLEATPAGTPAAGEGRVPMLYRAQLPAFLASIRGQRQSRTRQRRCRT